MLISAWCAHHHTINSTRPPLFRARDCSASLHTCGHHPTMLCRTQYWCSRLRSPSTASRAVPRRSQLYPSFGYRFYTDSHSAHLVTTYLHIRTNLLDYLKESYTSENFNFELHSWCCPGATGETGCSRPGEVAHIGIMPLFCARNCSARSTSEASYLLANE